MDISKAEIAGPCSIVFNGVNLGHTLGGVTFKAKRNFTPVNVDKYGNTPIDFILNGTEATVEFDLAQPNYPQLAVAFPEDANYDGAGGLDRIALGADAGYSLRQNAARLVIHPLKNAATNLADDVVLYKAVSTGEIDIPFKVDGQKIVPMIMTALVDESYGVGRRLGHIGVTDVS